MFARHRHLVQTPAVVGMRDVLDGVGRVFKLGQKPWLIAGYTPPVLKGAGGLASNAVQMTKLPSPGGPRNRTVLALHVLGEGLAAAALPCLLPCLERAGPGELAPKLFQQRRGHHLLLGRVFALE